MFSLFLLLALVLDNYIGCNSQYSSTVQNLMNGNLIFWKIMLFTFFFLICFIHLSFYLPSLTDYPLSICIYIHSSIYPSIYNTPNIYSNLSIHLSIIHLFIFSKLSIIHLYSNLSVNSFKPFYPSITPS